jgi:ceramide glucosyltransferase
MVASDNYALLTAATLLAGQLTSIAAAWPRKRSLSEAGPRPQTCQLTIIRPLSGVEAWSEATLRSTFELDHPDVKLLLCVARANDPILGLVQRVVVQYPSANVELLIGNEAISANPKLNNFVKGWAKTTSEWVAFVDSNVLLPPDAISRLLECWDEQCGMVCAPPIGAHTMGLSAELESTFLNAYQARFQIAAAALGMGFAQGKVMFFKRDLLEQAGGLAALASEPAEDAAATKVVRAAGLHVRLVSKPFEQPLGHRRFSDVWRRQLRWSQLRRATFPRYFYLEIATGAASPTLALASGLGELSVLVLPIYLATWYGAEYALAVRHGWPMSPWALPLLMLRDLLIIPLWVTAIFKNSFEWQGHAMRVDEQDAASP